MKNIFIIAPFFPPSALPPSQRVRLLIKYLPDFGWHPTVFTVEDRLRGDVGDPWMYELTGNNFDLIRVKCLDQNKTRRFGIGDLGLRMLPFLKRAILDAIKKQKPDLILYPVPPWYIMTIAPSIKRTTGIPYAIDYIDPWVFKLRHKTSKAIISQWIAKTMEGRIVKKSSAIFAVSQGILDDLKLNYPAIEHLPMISVPYGAEVSDYDSIVLLKRFHDKIEIRYTGAISENMLPVMDDLLAALKIVNKNTPLTVKFTGTSYAGAGLAKPVLKELIQKNQVEEFVSEIPLRVSYKEALELNKSADLLLLVGDTTPYYAASKMMGMVASGKPFFAWINANSFPAKFLDGLGFKHRLFFQKDELGSIRKIEELASAISYNIQNISHFEAISIDHPEFKKYTAKEMTKTFTDTFKKIQA